VHEYLSVVAPKPMTPFAVFVGQRRVHLHGFVEHLPHHGTGLLANARFMYALYTNVCPTAVLFSVFHIHIKLANPDLLFFDNFVFSINGVIRAAYFCLRSAHFVN
ncbi:hypothetical protein LSAT2_010573, partial [Lamellibrachia satsuma]